MREIDPFDYWERHASAIEGLGGQERSPDPRYLFHTRYYPVRAGHARFVVRLDEVRASFGELSVRVHAWKPEGDSNVSLVAGTRAMLLGDEGAEVNLTVHFAAQKGVLYALYGYLSEDSDVAARAIHVAIDEPEDTSDLVPEPPRSILALRRQTEHTRSVNTLQHYGRIDIQYPGSQSCTVEQVAALGCASGSFFGRERAEDYDAVIGRWSEALCLNALATYGVTEPGLEGLIVGSISAESAQRLVSCGPVARSEDRQPPSRMCSDFYDFLLMPSGLAEATDARLRWQAVEDWMARLKIGGLAVLCLRYLSEGNLVGSSAIADAPTLSRNEIGQWSLRLIGGGYSVAPLAFAPVSELVVDQRGVATFALIIQRI